MTLLLLLNPKVVVHSLPRGGGGGKRHKLDRYLEQRLELHKEYEDFRIARSKSRKEERATAKTTSPEQEKLGSEVQKQKALQDKIFTEARRAFAARAELLRLERHAEEQIAAVKRQEEREEEEMLALLLIH